MKLVVPVKSVGQLDEDFEISEDGLGVDPDFLQYALNEWDAFSLEAALSLREQGGGEVVVVSVGAQAQECLRSCLAMGADRAVHVWTDAPPLTGPLTVARVLSGVVAREHPDLVLTGAQSSDGASAATGVALAALLGLAHVAVIKKIEYDPQAGYLRVDRELEGGLVQRMRVRAPAVLSVQSGINKPRYATLRAIKQAEQKPLETLSLEDLDLSTGELEQASDGRLRRVYVPDSLASAAMLDGSPGEVAAKIAELIGTGLGS